jgi:hypothetical protein
MAQIHCIYINVEPERKMKKDKCKLKTCVNQIVYFERKIGFQKKFYRNDKHVHRNFVDAIL